MLSNPRAAFAMFLLCYAQCLDYLLRTMFLFLGILQQYIEFNVCTIIMLEKLFGVKSFGGSIDHLACR
jgi:hypothetical protein